MPVHLLERTYRFEKRSETSTNVALRSDPSDFDDLAKANKYACKHGQQSSSVGSPCHATTKSDLPEVSS